MVYRLLYRTPEASISCGQCKETWRCIKTTTAISVHKKLFVAAHFSLAKEVNELTKLAQISLIKEANWSCFLYTSPPVCGGLLTMLHAAPQAHAFYGLCQTCQFTEYLTMQIASVLTFSFWNHLPDNSFWRQPDMLEVRDFIHAAFENDVWNSQYFF